MESKISKAEQTARTRRAILDHARKLFATQGYAAKGTAEMIAGLGITRGALYHQFENKQGVFRAVLEEIFIEIVQYIEAQAVEHETPWAQLIQGSHAFLDIAQREDIRRLVFTETPAVLDAETLTKLDHQYGYSLLLEAVQAVVEIGELNVPDAEGFAMMLNEALEHLAFWTTQTGDSERLTTAKALVEQLLMLHHKT